MDPPECSQNYLTTLSQFFRSNFDYNLLISASEEIVKLKKDEFINRFQDMVGDENKNKNNEDKLNLIRLKLARHVIETFSLSNDTQI
ncbi:hypothetical protein BpHYR1_029780, partial [Brachionus plicatilis]